MRLYAITYQRVYQPLALGQVKPEHWHAFCAWCGALAGSLVDVRGSEPLEFEAAHATKVVDTSVRLGGSDAVRECVLPLRKYLAQAEAALGHLVVIVEPPIAPDAPSTSWVGAVAWVQVSKLALHLQPLGDAVGVWALGPAGGAVASAKLSWADVVVDHERQQTVFGATPADDPPPMPSATTDGAGFGMLPTIAGAAAVSPCVIAALDNDVAVVPVVTATAAQHCPMLLHIITADAAVLPGSKLMLHGIIRSLLDTRSVVAAPTAVLYWLVRDGQDLPHIDDAHDASVGADGSFELSVQIPSDAAEGDYVVLVGLGRDNQLPRYAHGVYVRSKAVPPFSLEIRRLDGGGALFFGEECLFEVEVRRQGGSALPGCLVTWTASLLSSLGI